jgi:hypothetical protein
VIVEVCDPHPSYVNFVLSSCGHDRDMASRIIAFLITLLAKIIAGIAIVFVMLIAMNGYSESDASWVSVYF